jgi:asparagine N-glycosylation enzyme membrane subunit Stt3
VASRLVGRTARQRARFEAFCRLVEADRPVRWGAISLIPILWISLAWQDARALVGIVIVCVSVAAAHGFRPIELPPPDDSFEDWF